MHYLFDEPMKKSMKLRLASKRLMVGALFFFSTLLQESVYAQNFVATINQLPTQGCNVILEYFNEDSWKNFMSMPVDAKSQVSLQVPFDHSGQYRIRLSNDPEKWGDFIIPFSKSPTAKFTLNINYQDLKKKPIPISGSPEVQLENKAYAEWMNAYNTLSLNPDSLNRKELSYLKREKDFGELCKKIQKDYPNTYTAKVLCKTQMMPTSPEWSNPTPNVDSIRVYNAKHGFDNAPFSSSEIIYHIGFVRKLNLHFEYFAEKNLVTQYIDQVMTKALVNEQNSAFLFRFMLDKMLDYKNEEGLDYLITWYSSDCTENEHADNATKNLLLALENCKPGKTVESLVLPDINGKEVALKEVCASNKVTLLLFWKTSCSHCREFEPVLKEIYERYHSKGIEVYAIGTDKMEEMWKSESAAAPFPWPSVFLAYTSRKDFSKRFPVPSTPTLIAVDKNGKILRRVIMRSKLESELDQMLREVTE
jgi:thiol-disulfide isomerase/thioredoxin